MVHTRCSTDSNDMSFRRLPVDRTVHRPFRALHFSPQSGAECLFTPALRAVERNVNLLTGRSQFESAEPLNVYCFYRRM
jgi:hypothetical protein